MSGCFSALGKERKGQEDPEHCKSKLAACLGTVQDRCCSLAAQGHTGTEVPLQAGSTEWPADPEWMEPQSKSRVQANAASSNTQPSSEARVSPRTHSLCELKLEPEKPIPEPSSCLGVLLLYAGLHGKHSAELVRGAGFELSHDGAHTQGYWELSRASGAVAGKDCPCCLGRPAASGHWPCRRLGPRPGSP